MDFVTNESKTVQLKDKNSNNLVPLIPGFGTNKVSQYSNSSSTSRYLPSDLNVEALDDIDISTLNDNSVVTFKTPKVTGNTIWELDSNSGDGHITVDGTTTTIANNTVTITGQDTKIGCPSDYGYISVDKSGNVKVYSSETLSLTGKSVLVNGEAYGQTSGGDYVLPTATSSTLGGVKVGAGLTIEQDGTLSSTSTSGNLRINTSGNTTTIDTTTTSGASGGDLAITSGKTSVSGTSQTLTATDKISLSSSNTSNSSTIEISAGKDSNQQKLYMYSSTGGGTTLDSNNIALGTSQSTGGQVTIGTSSKSRVDINGKSVYVNGKDIASLTTSDNGLSLGETDDTAYKGSSGKATTDKLNTLLNSLSSNITLLNDESSFNFYTHSTSNDVTINYAIEGQQIADTGELGRYSDSFFEGSIDLPAATTSTAGVMTAEDKKNLSNASTTINSLPDQIIYGSSDTNLLSVLTSESSLAIGVHPMVKNSEGVYKPGTNKTYGIPAATTTAAGVMSAADKVKLDNLGEKVTQKAESSSSTDNHYLLMSGDTSKSESTGDICKVSTVYKRGSDGALINQAPLLTKTLQVQAATQLGTKNYGSKTTIYGNVELSDGSLVGDGSGVTIGDESEPLNLNGSSVKINGVEYTAGGTSLGSLTIDGSTLTTSTGLVYITGPSGVDITATEGTAKLSNAEYGGYVAVGSDVDGSKVDISAHNTNIDSDVTITGSLNVNGTEITGSTSADIPSLASLLCSGNGWVIKIKANTSCQGVKNTTSSDDWFRTRIYQRMGNDNFVSNGAQNCVEVAYVGGYSTSIENMFSGCSALSSLDASIVDTEGATNMSSVFSNCSSLSKLNLETWNMDNVTTMASMFEGCTNLTEITFPESITTSNLTSMRDMFSECTNLKTINNFDFDVSKVTTMENLFYNCQNIQFENTESFNWSDTSKLTSLKYMFGNCSSLQTLTLMFDTDSVTDMSYMFDGCSKLTTLNIERFNTKNVTKTTNMFDDCSSLNYIYLTKEFFNTLQPIDLSSTSVGVSNGKDNGWLKYLDNMLETVTAPHTIVLPDALLNLDSSSSYITSLKNKGYTLTKP